MSKNLWVIGGSLWLVACGGTGGNGTGNGGEGEKPPTTGQKEQQVRACILQRLPRPEGALEWEVSGHALVQAYVQCQETPDEATAADFRTVVQGMAQHVEGDPSRVRLSTPQGAVP